MMEAASSALMNFRKPDWWPMYRLRLMIFHQFTTFGVNDLIDAQIMTVAAILNWFQVSILNTLSTLYYSSQPSYKIS